jgi:hypothetical protein
MKIKKLATYIARYDSLEVADYVMRSIEVENIQDLSVEDGLHLIHRVLSYICFESMRSKIMKKFIKHEIRRGRLTQEYLDRYSCIGCIEDKPNQLAHTCLYDEK